MTRQVPAILAELRAAISTAPVAELPSIIGAVEAVKWEAFARLLTPAAVPADDPDDDRLLIDADEAAKMLGVTSRWVRDHQAQLGRVQLPGRTLRFSAKRIAAMVKRRSYSS